MNAVAVKNAYRKEQSQMTNKHLNSESYKHEVEQFAKRNHDKWATTADETLQRHPKTGHWEHKPKDPKSPYQDELDKKWDTAKRKLKAPVDMEAILALEEKLWNS
jgi:hypothetical protein